MEINNDFGWMSSTHEPLTKAVMELYMPGYVLELGSGLYSTSILKQYDAKIISVETNLEWLNYVKENINSDIIFHPLGDYNINNHVTELSKEEKRDIILFYEGIELPDIKPNLLFVDQFLAGRILSINNIGNKFDLIICHDSEPETRVYYGYDLIDIKGYNTYYLSTPFTWASVMIKKRIDKGIRLLNRIIKLHIENYAVKYPYIQWMKLIKK